MPKGILASNTAEGQKARSMLTAARSRTEIFAIVIPKDMECSIEIHLALMGHHSWVRTENENIVQHSFQQSKLIGIWCMGCIRLLTIFDHHSK